MSHSVISANTLRPFCSYDTFSFLHRPTLGDQASEASIPKELLYCILAFASRHCQPLRDFYYESFPDKFNAITPSEHYATLASQLLQFPPSAASGRTGTAAEGESDISLIRCQCFLILGLHECTEGTENRGWMKIGTAIRMAQVLRLGFEDEDDASQSAPARIARRDPLRAEIRRRTYWSCFLLDRTITDGKERPCTLQPPKNGAVRMPCSEEDFTKGIAGVGARFEPDPAPWTVSARLLQHPPPPEPEADLHGHTLRVAQLWKKVADYIGAAGGRNFDRRPPWLLESTFGTLAAEIAEFKRRLPQMYEYSEANLLAHSMTNQGRLFGMFHLLLACSSLVLHRDYLPFLPPLNFRAVDGPCDGEPLYEPNGSMPAPADWWVSSLAHAFEAANSISDLCTYLAQHGSMITHPFAGFAAVAAATLHVHLKYWPQSSRNNGNASAYLEQDARIVAALRDVCESSPACPLADPRAPVLTSSPLRLTRPHRRPLDRGDPEAQPALLQPRARLGQPRRGPRRGAGVGPQAPPHRHRRGRGRQLPRLCRSRDGRGRGRTR